MDAQSGIVVRRNKVRLQGGFSTYFIMQLHGGTNPPADGLTFVIQDNDTPQVGLTGGGVGYAGIPNSIGIEFDIWLNNEYNDPSERHVAINVNGNVNHFGYMDYVVSDPGIYGNDVHVWVDYTASAVTVTWGPSATRLSVGNQSLTRESGVSHLNDKDVFVGFAASTGGSNANHDIKKWYFKDSYVPGGLSSAPNSYSQGPSSIQITLSSPVNPSSATIEALDASGNAMANQEVSLALSGAPLGTFSTGAGAQIDYSFESLPVGSHTLTATAAGGGSTNSASFTVADPPGTPTSLNVAAIETDRATLSWEASSGTPAITYHWAIYPSGGGAVNSGDTTSTSVTPIGLSVGTEYYFTVFASNAAGISGLATSSVFTTLKLNQAAVSGSLGSTSIQYGSTTTINASGGSGTGDYEFQRTGGTDCVSFSGTGVSRTINGTALGSTTVQVRRLGDSNYNDSPWTSVDTIEVTQRQLTGSFTIQSPKIYDNTTNANVLTRSLSNLASWDTEDADGVFLTGGMANFDTKDVGSNKTVTLTGMTLSGASSSNYLLDIMNTTTGDIIPGSPSMEPNPPKILNMGVNPPAEGVISQVIAGEILDLIKVRLYDAFGNPVASGHEVTVFVNQGSFTPESTLTVVTDGDGYATFDNLTITASGIGYELTFSVTESGP